MFLQPCLPWSMHCIILWCLSWTHTPWVHTFVLFFFFQILVRSRRSLFPISWPFIANPEWLQRYLQTRIQEALRIGPVLHVPSSSLKPGLCSGTWRPRSSGKQILLHWAAEQKQIPTRSMPGKIKEWWRWCFPCNTYCLFKFLTFSW